MDNLEIADIYLDLIGIIEVKFRERIGNEFPRILNRCRNSLPFQCKELLKPVGISNEINKGIAEEICGFLPVNGKTAESRLLLISSLNQLSFLLIMKIKEAYGVDTAAYVLYKMLEMLDKKEKDNHDRSIIEYLKGNIDDFLKQIKED